MSSLLITFLYITQSSAKILIVDKVFLQTSIPYVRNRKGLNKLSCATPDITQTSCVNCPPTLTLCVRLKRNFLTHATTIESTPEFPIFISSRSCRTKSKAFEKSITIALILSPLSIEFAMSWQTVITWLSHEYPGLNPCLPWYNQSFLSQTCLQYDAITCSICLQNNEF
jgi:hypothetical protein